MFKNKTVRNLVFLWLAWVLIVLGYQAWAANRMLPKRPDFARPWTAEWTTALAQAGKPYLLEPFMNNQVAWDSEFYLSIAVAGYEDPDVTRAEVNLNQVDDDPANDYQRAMRQISLSYAFFPFYPVMIWLFSWPLKLLGLTPIATATLAAVIVSALGALAGMVALYFLTRDALEDAGGWRAAFYLIAFPSAFFMAVVYTEGLFIGLAFSALALTLRRKWLWAGILAACAALTRSVGVALVIPMGIVFLRDLDYKSIRSNFSLARAGQVGLTLLPLVTFLAWKVSPLGQTFDVIQAAWFGRGFLDFQRTFDSWRYAWDQVTSVSGPSFAYHLMEMVIPVLALVACGFTLKRHPELTLFSLTVILFALFSGDIQGMYRYVLAAPVLFIFLSRLGRNEAFDRAWTIASILLLGMNAYLFAMDMWAG
ncbi:MAG: hypothetical protein JXB85_05145 [Anaerolineales bacterium]|nr:hypothetical protein [Anaerolineales bacterium]